MNIVELRRRKDYTDNHYIDGSSVVLELTYNELALLNGALAKYFREGDISEYDKDRRFFKWQFATIMEIVKEGAPTSFIADLFQHYCRPEQKEEAKE